jgi:hypothetical protein
MDRRLFRVVLAEIWDNPVFHNESNKIQEPIEWQLFVALTRLGHDGNASGVLSVTNTFSISGTSIPNAAAAKCCSRRSFNLFICTEGTVLNWTRRVVFALVDIADRHIKWPNADERDQIKTRIGQSSSFGHAVGCVDGSLLPLAFKPAVPTHWDYFNRKHAYSLNAMFVCDDQHRVTFIGLGWGGATHDTRVYKNTPAGHNHTFLRIMLLCRAMLTVSLCHSSIFNPIISLPRNNTCWPTQVTSESLRTTL